MIQRFLRFLGPAHARALFLLLALTGLFSLILNTGGRDNPDVQLPQTILLAVFLVGAAIIIGHRLQPADRARWVAIALPALGAVLLGLTVLPTALPLLIGAAFGWIVAGLFIFRARIPMEYQKAIKLLRKNAYDEAITVINDVIKSEPDTPGHYRFRAELLRLTGKLKQAQRDYQRMIELAPDAPDAYNGLSEVNLQMGDHAAALAAAAKASQLAPDDWVALYNLGMIEDRVRHSDDAIAHLQKALEIKVPDARHRLLIHLYLARAYARTGDEANARGQIDHIRKHKLGLEEWNTILESEQASTLREVIGEDVAAAQRLMRDPVSLSDVADGRISAVNAAP